MTAKYKGYEWDSDEAVLSRVFSDLKEARDICVKYGTVSDVVAAGWLCRINELASFIRQRYGQEAWERLT